MADDIDIEEHDVLDHPRIKHILPDLDLDLIDIKTEARDEEDEDCMICEEDYKPEDHNSFRNAFTYEDPEVQYTRIGNKIILGSKPCSSTNSPIPTINKEYPLLTSLLEADSTLPNGSTDNEVKTEPPDDYDDFYVQQRPSVFILGSKPSTETSVHLEERNVEDAIVFLEDWGPRLERSSCYCKECKILFPTRNAIDSHKMSVHSFLVALDINKAVKSTAKKFDFKNTARKSTGFLNQPDTSNANCHHCSKTFSDYTALIKHLYDIIPSDKYKCDKCEAVFDKEAELKTHIEGHDNQTSYVGIRDKKSHYFKCSICSCFFVSLRRYQRHMQRSHLETQLDYTKYPLSLHCENCPSKLKDMLGLNGHIRKIHPKIFMMKSPSHKEKQKVKNMQRMGALLNSRHKNSSQIKSPQKLVPEPKLTHMLPQINPETSQINSDARKCLVCHEEFSSYYSAKAHKIKKHPDFKNLHIFNKVAFRKRALPSQLQKAAKAPLKKAPEECVYKDVSNSPVPKDALFKCNHCLLHFTSCSAAGIHSRNCLQYKGDWKCQICRRMFKMNDRLIHQQQHEIVDRFNVYTINDHLYGRVLCQCPDCNLYFHEEDFWVHYKFGCRLSKPCECPECHLPIHALSIDVHKRWHQDLEIGCDEFILINYVNVNTDIVAESQRKRKLAEISECTPAKKAKFEQEDKDYAVTMYYCKVCKCNMSGLKHKEHTEGTCLKPTLQTKICKVCGMMISIKSLHSKIHEQQRGLKLRDFKIIRIQDKKRISPPIPEYPKCNKCDVLFISKKALLRHECHTGHKTCRYCKKKFSDLAYKLHVQFHEYTAKIPKPQQLEKSDKIPDYDIPKKKKDMPDLLERYEQLTKTWNILYLCQICDIVCDSYDKVVEHCQNHFSNLESYDMIVKECRVCDLRFDGTCFDKHRALHSTNQSVNRTSFDILTYNYMNLLSDEWLNLFGDLPQSQIQQIISRSIYSYTRKIKMRLIVDGPPEFTLYKCAKCEKYVNPLTLAEHYKYTSCSKTSIKYHCQVCRIPFSSASGKKNHTLTHKNNKIKTFRSVLINEDGDEEFNRTLETQEGETQTIKRETAKMLKSFRFFKCAVCQCCFKDVFKHETCKHGSGKPRKFCPKCNLFFSSKSMFCHKKDHEKIPALSSKNLKITLFTPKEKHNQYTKKITIYKCGCGLHFTSQKTVDKHLAECSPDQEISSENCSKCGLLFPTDVLVNHLLSHHSNDKYTKFEIKDISSGESADKGFKVYKCTKCDLCYMSLSSIQNHFSLKHAYSIKLKCNTCGLKFTKSSLMRHISYHHLKHKCQLKDIKIEVYSGQTRKETPAYNVSKRFLSTLNLKNYSRKLYKCPECPLHFLVKVSLSNHKASGTHETKENKIGKKCTKCGITFGYQTLPRHKFIHHDKLKLSLKDFIIVHDTGVATKSRNFKSNDTQAAIPNTDKRPMDRFTNLDGLQSSLKNKCSRNLYKCTKCDLHFITLESLRWHSVTNKHQTKMQITKCNMCGLKFTRFTLSRHLNKHHQNMKLKLENFNIITIDFKGDEGNKNPQNSDQDTTGIDFQEAESNSDDSRDKYSESEYTSSNRTELYNYLYKCDDCDLHFLNKDTLGRHIAAQRHDDPGKICSNCDLKFQSVKSLRKHKDIQHSELDLSREDFCILYSKNIFTDENDTASMRFNANEKKGNSVSRHSIKPSQSFLYKCKICSVHVMNEHTLQYHWNTDGRHKAVRAVSCTNCGLNFGTHSLKKHINIHHDQMKLELKDFAIITASIIDGNYVTNCVYKCNNCHLYFTKHHAFEGHKCSNPPQNAGKCAICRYLFNINSMAHHKKTHHDLLRLKRDEIKVIRLNNEGRETVNADDEFIESETGNSTANEDKSYNKSFNKETNSSLDMSSNKKYLYKCSTCNLHYISKKALKNHKGRFKKMCKSRVIEIECDLCGLNFGPQMLQQHREAHHESLNLQLEDFTIVTESKLDTKLDNLDIDSQDSDSDFDGTFDDSKRQRNIVEAGTSQIVKTRKICKEVFLNKVTLSQLNRKTFENRLYKCSVCAIHFISFGALRTHSHHATNTTCTVCGLKFTTYTLPRHVYVHHKKLKCKKFKITVCGEDDTTSGTVCMPKSPILDRDTDLTHCSTSMLDVTDIESSKSKNMDSTPDVGIVNVASNAVDDDNTVTNESTTTTREYKITNAFKKKLYRNLKKYGRYLYKCSICSLHYMTFDNLKKHESSCQNDLVNTAVCDRCDLSFSSVVLARHCYIHHEIMKLKREDITVTDSKLSAPKQSATSKVLRILQDDSSIVDTPVTTVSVDENVILQRDNKVDEMRTNTSTPLLTNDKDHNNKLYRCNECDVHFTNKKSFDGHVSQKLHFVIKKACLKCGLDFSLHTMSTHMKLHHEEFNLKREDFEIIDKYTPNEAIKDSDTDFSQSNDPESSIDEGSSPRTEKNTAVAKKYPIKLYKCGECNVYFITQATCYKHTSKHTALDNKDYIECKICGFQFRIISLHKHITMHHATDFRLEDVLIEEYQPNTSSNGTPKIDIYAAINKVQSKLVSTTTESRELDFTDTEQNLNEQIEDSIITDDVVNSSHITNSGKNDDLVIVSGNVENDTDDVSTVTENVENVENVTGDVSTVTENFENVENVTDYTSTVADNFENVENVKGDISTVKENFAIDMEKVMTVTENVDTVTENAVAESVETVEKKFEEVTAGIEYNTENDIIILD